MTIWAENTASVCEPPVTLWEGLAATARGVEQGDAGAQEALYDFVKCRGQLLLWRRMRGCEQEIEDRIHEVYLITLSFIQRGRLRDPKCVGSFVRTVILRQGSAAIGGSARQRRESAPLAVMEDRQPGPEEKVIEEQRRQRMVEALKTLRPQEREILSRFYLGGETPQQICEALNISYTQFRLLKSRAKAKLTERIKTNMTDAGSRRTAGA